jgi:glyoxylase-like metal-dependent hydrolase (beta-lactamase superfamily II)
MNTHGHVDHAGGNEQFEEIHIHAADLTMLDPAWQQSQRDMLFGYVKKAYPIFVPVLMFFKLQRFAKCKPTVKTIEDGARFELGGRTLTVIHFPGHSPGSMILADDRTRTLYVGDAVNHGLFLFFEDSPTLKEYGAALRKLARLEGFDSIRISHGAMTLPFDFIDYYAEFLDRVTLDKSVLTDIPNGDRPVLKYSESDERYGLPEIAVHFTKESLEG